MPKDESYTLIDFTVAYDKLKDSNTNLFNNSFDKNIISKNISLITEKRYAITDDIWNIDEEQNFRFISALNELLKSHAKEYSDNIEKISNIFNKDIPFSKKFTLNVLKNECKIILDFANSNNLSNDFITFFSILSAFPYRDTVASFVKSKVNLREHISGFCPVCGHWPGISYLTEKEGKKIMACICCGAVWSFRRMKCSFCLSSNKDVLGYLNIENEKEISAYTCDTCRRYLKTIRIGDEEDIFETKWHIIDYLSSGDLDIAALQNKYLQEPILATRFQGPLDEHLDLYIKKSI